MPQISKDNLLPSLTPNKEKMTEITVMSFNPVGKNNKRTRRTITVPRNVRNVSYQKDEFDSKDEIYSITDTDFMSMPSNEVMYGSPHSTIDNMPSMARMLVEDQTFVSFSNRLFRMVDPETQASSYLAAKRQVLENNKIKTLPMSKADPLEGYEFENGGGLDEEEIQEWIHGGKNPSLLAFFRDIMPGHQCDEAQLLIMEKATNKQILVIPDAHEHRLYVLSGEASIDVYEENKMTNSQLSINKFITIGGTKFVEITCISEEDLVLAIGKTTLEEEENDVLTHVMKNGYQDVHTMHESTSSDIEDDLTVLYENEDEKEDEPDYSFIPEGTIPDISSLSENIPSENEEQVKLYIKETNGIISIEEWRIRKKHKNFMNLLSAAFDSPYAGKGFRPPQARWIRIIQETESLGSLKAYHRYEYFRSLHERAKRVKSYTELYGSRVWTCPHCGTKNEHTGFNCLGENCKNPEFANKTGFYSKIKELNLHDKNIGLEWSEQSRKYQDKKTEEWITIPSAFDRKRGQLIKELRAKGTSEGKINGIVWHRFDKKPKRKDTIYNHAVVCFCGQEFTDQTSIKQLHELCCPCCKITKFKSINSIKLENYRQSKTAKRNERSEWDKDRTEAYLELNCTLAQWNTIYKQLLIQKKRLYLQTNLTEERQEAFNALRSMFRDCNSIQDIMDFKQEMHKQYIDKKGDIIVQSLRDRISFNDERKIMIAIAKLQKQLLNKS